MRVTFVGPKSSLSLSIATIFASIGTATSQAAQLDAYAYRPAAQQPKQQRFDGTLNVPKLAWADAEPLPPTISTTSHYTATGDACLASMLRLPRAVVASVKAPATVGHARPDRHPAAAANPSTGRSASAATRSAGTRPRPRGSPARRRPPPRTIGRSRRRLRAEAAARFYGCVPDRRAREAGAGGGGGRDAGEWRVRAGRAARVGPGLPRVRRARRGAKRRTRPIFSSLRVSCVISDFARILVSCFFLSFLRHLDARAHNAHLSPCPLYPSSARVVGRPRLALLAPHVAHVEYG